MNGTFTLVYTFAATSVFMEMNFPHKELAVDQDAEISAGDLQGGDYAALIAHVIARQSLSHSARSVHAHELKLAAAIAANRGQSFQNRIRFFAGDHEDHKDSNHGNLFVRGHFRPDVADRIFSENSAMENL